MGVFIGGGKFDGCSLLVVYLMVCGELIEWLYCWSYLVVYIIEING